MRPGESNFLAKPKLTSKQREEISQRYADGETAVSLAQEFGVSTKVIFGFVPARNPGRFGPVKRKKK